MKRRICFLPTIALVALSFAGCETPEPAPAPMAAHAKSTPIGLARFEVTSYGGFDAGFGGHYREVAVLKDSKTGHEYLTITGAGVTELWTETRTHSGPKGISHTETVTVEE